MGDGRIIEWRGKRFSVAEGSLHPAYSLHTFDEEREFKERHWNPQDGEVVFDVGASYGAYTMPALASGAIVHAFEPEPSVWADLNLNVELNGWNHRFYSTCGGLWSEAGEIDMHDYAPHWPSHTITGRYKMNTLDNVVAARKVERMDWLKIDVEGAELEVLRGGASSIEKLKPKLIIECHVFLDQALKTFAEAMLREWGYSFSEEPRDPCIMLVGSPS